MGNRIYISLDKEYIKEKLENEDYKKRGIVEFVEKNLELDEEYIVTKQNQITTTFVNDNIYISITRDLDIGYLTEVIEYITKKMNKFKTIVEAMK